MAPACSTPRVVHCIKRWRDWKGYSVARVGLSSAHATAHSVKMRAYVSASAISAFMVRSERLFDFWQSNVAAGRSSVTLTPRLNGGKTSAHNEDYGQSHAPRQPPRRTGWPDQSRAKEWRKVMARGKIARMVIAAAKKQAGVTPGAVKRITPAAAKR